MHEWTQEKIEIIGKSNISANDLGDLSKLYSELIDGNQNYEKMKIVLRGYKATIPIIYCAQRSEKYREKPNDGN